MRKFIALVLCFLLCFSTLPLAVQGAGTVHYAAVTGGTIVTEGIDSIDEAAAVEDCDIVVVYSLDDEPADLALNESISLGDGKKLVISNVELTGNVQLSGNMYSENLLLLGDTIVTTTGAGYVFSATSSNDTAKEALTSGSFNDISTLADAIADARAKYTVTGAVEIDSNLDVYDMVIDNDASFTINAPTGGGQSRLSVRHSLKVNGTGTLTAEPSQRLELRDSASVSGITFYESDGATEFDIPDSYDHLEFEYNGSKWIVMGGPGGPDGPGESAGALEGMDADGDGNFIVNTNTTVTSSSSVNLNSGSITINEGKTLTIEANARMELRGMSITNNGTIVLEADTAEDQPEHGRFELWNDVTPGILINTGTITINGSMELKEGAKLTNTSTGAISVNNRLRFDGGAILENNGGSITSEEHGQIELINPADITGQDFFESSEDTEPTTNLNGEFCYNADAEKWVRINNGGGGSGGDEGGGPGDDDPPGDGTLHTVTVTAPVNGSISAIGMADYTAEVLDREDLTFTITPDAGYMVSSVLVAFGDFINDQSWNLSYNGDGSFNFPLENVENDLTLEVIFQLESLEELLNQSYVVLRNESDSADEIKSVLVGQFGSRGYAVTTAAINDLEVSTAGIDDSGYGTFTFTVTLGDETSAAQTGYIVSALDDVIFKLTDEDGYTEIIVSCNTSDPSAAREVEVPAMHSGTMEILGYGNLVAAPFDSELLNEDGKVQLPFYRAQFHIFSFSSGLNLYGFYVIQADAFCVRVAADSNDGEQKTHTWDLGRYADLTEGSYTSNVFFGNDKFILSLPSSNIGGLETLTVETGSFSGYTVSVNDDETYCVEFLSDYYDFITLNLTINGSIQRQLNIHRVGVHIEPVIWEEGPSSFNVGHGTQIGTFIDFSDGNLFRVYATYNIPDNVTTAPYGLYVTYTWANGTVTTDIITDPCDDPSPGRNAEDYVDGVFIYNNYAACCDYLLYSAPNSSNAPVRINVTVLKGDPGAGTDFSGIFFGSGAGVEWNLD